MFDEPAGSGAMPGTAAGAEPAFRPDDFEHPDGASHPNSADMIDRLVVLRAEAARREAEMLALMAEFVRTRRVEDAGGPGERFSEGFAVDELALALVTTRHRVHQQLHLAEALGGQLAATGQLLRSGRIDGYQVWVIHDMMCRLVDDEHIAEVEADILARAPGLTGGQIRSRLAKLITAREPDAFAARHQQAMRDRRVSANTGGADARLDGMGSLWFCHAAVDIAAIDDRITRIARAVTRNPDGTAADGDDDRSWRSFDNVRADVARDLLLGRDHPCGEPPVTHETGRTGGDSAAATHAAAHTDTAARTDAGAPGGPDRVGTSPVGRAPSAGDTAEAARSLGPDGCPTPPRDPARSHPSRRRPARGSSAADSRDVAASRSARPAGDGVQVFVVVPVQTLMGSTTPPVSCWGMGRSRPGWPGRWPVRRIVCGGGC